MHSSTFEMTSSPDRPSTSPRVRRSVLLAWTCLSLLGFGSCGGELGTEAADELTAQSGALSSTRAVLRFVAIGDVGKGNQAQKDVAAAIAQKCMISGCDFVQLLGDNIYDSGVSSVDDPQWQTKFEIPYAAISVPFYVVLGNHDYGGGGAGTEFRKGDIQVAYSAKSTKWRLPGTHWHRQVGNVEMVGLDTNLAFWYRDVDKQKMNVNSWLSSSTATWKIAFGHHPMLSNGEHGNAGNYDGLWWLPIASGAGVRDFMNDSVCGKVDLYISGHDHSRQWLTGTCKGTELAVSGGGASTTDLPGHNMARFQSDQSGFLYVVINDRMLTAEFIDKTGKVEFTRTLTK